MMCNIVLTIPHCLAVRATILMTHLGMSLIMTSVRVRNGNRCDGFIPAWQQDNSCGYILSQILKSISVRSRTKADNVVNSLRSIPSLLHMQEESVKDDAV